MQAEKEKRQRTERGQPGTHGEERGGEREKRRDGKRERGRERP